MSIYSKGWKKMSRFCRYYRIGNDGALEVLNDIIRFHSRYICIEFFSNGIANFNLYTDSGSFFKQLCLPEDKVGEFFRNAPKTYSHHINLVSYTNSTVKFGKLTLYYIPDEDVLTLERFLPFGQHYGWEVGIPVKETIENLVYITPNEEPDLEESEWLVYYMNLERLWDYVDTYES